MRACVSVGVCVRVRGTSVSQGADGVGLGAVGAGDVQQQFAGHAHAEGLLQTQLCRAQPALLYRSVLAIQFLIQMLSYFS